MSSYDLSSRAPGAHERRQEPHDSLDDFPTPPWATRALLEILNAEEFMGRQTVWEPTCNRGYMARVLANAFGEVLATDIDHYGWPGQGLTVDFLWPGEVWRNPVDWIICNPPYRLAREFILRAIDLAPRQGVAIFGRLGLIEGQRRYRDIHSRYRNLIIYPFAERVQIFKGQVSADTAKPMAHAWYVWRRPFEEAPDCPDIRVRHIAPCRKRLERPGDYEPMRLRGLPAAAE